jgi:hypothetical protein
VIEGSQTVAMLVAAEHLARSSGGATVAMDRRAIPGDLNAPDGLRERTDIAAPGLSRARWLGRSDRARLLQGLDAAPRVVGARG